MNTKNMKVKFPRKRNSQLCCLVKAVAKCHMCRTHVCPEHMVYCHECGISCTACNSLSACQSCSTEVCRFCMKVAADKRLQCPYCYISDSIDEEDTPWDQPEIEMYSKKKEAEES